MKKVNIQCLHKCDKMITTLVLYTIEEMNLTQKNEIMSKRIIETIVRHTAEWPSFPSNKVVLQQLCMPLVVEQMLTWASHQNIALSLSCYLYHNISKFKFHDKNCNVNTR